MSRLQFDKVCEHVDTVRDSEGNVTDAQSLADQFHYSHSQFSRLFKGHMHLRLRDYLAAKKMEIGVTSLLNNDSVTEALLTAGYSSTGSFSNNFKKATGLSPRDYQQRIHFLFKFINACYQNNVKSIITYRPSTKDKSKDSTDKPTLPLNITINNQSTNAVTFVGLFEKAIPSGRPIQGFALFGLDKLVIEQVPTGEYYLMACEIPLSANPLNYFSLDHAKRAIHRQPLEFPLSTSQAIALALREKALDDPPITINLPQLLYEAFMSQSH